MSSEAAPAANIVELWSGASQRLAAAMTAMAGKAPSAAATRPFDPSALFSSMSALMAGWARGTSCRGSGRAVATSPIRN